MYPSMAFTKHPGSKCTRCNSMGRPGVKPPCPAGCCIRRNSRGQASTTQYRKPATPSTAVKLLAAAWAAGGCFMLLWSMH
ncbi:hypothetical protein BR93DRAFT_473032 [Coniochaeta sp. PMI_546]|nr:hypothetical protein BR93DRAFT_473032 [Coniochaeta sp. PMI_546]